MPLEATGQLRTFTSAEITAMNIRTFDIRYGAHPTYTREVDQNTMVRKFLVDWDERENFCELVCGRVKTWVDVATTRITRLLPDGTYGRDPSAPQVIATKILDIRGHAAGIDDANDMPEYTDAEVTVFYEEAVFNLVTDATVLAGSERDRYTSIGPNMAGESESLGPLAHGIYKYVRNGGGAGHLNPVPFGVMRQRPVERFVVWMEQMPYELVSGSGALRTRLYYGENAGGGVPDGIPYLGCVNSDTLSVPSIPMTWNPETLLLEKVERVLQRGYRPSSDTANLRFRVGLHFAFAPRGWLDLLHPVHGTWLQVANDDAFHATGTMPDNTGLYNLRVMAQLWNPNY